MWAIFGHGNVAGIGEAVAAYRTELPTYRAHNEQVSGNWWDVGVSEVSPYAQVMAARAEYEANRAAQRLAD